MSPKATSHTVSCCVVLNEMARVASRSCVTTAKITTTKLKTTGVTLRTATEKAPSSGVFLGNLGQPPHAMAIHQLSIQFGYFPSIRLARPGPLLKKMISRNAD
jgi:hypothetical protein